MYPREATPFRVAGRCPGIRMAWFPVQGSGVKSWRKVAFRISARLVLIQCCIPFSEITFFLVSMGHDLVESILAV